MNRDTKRNERISTFLEWNSDGELVEDIIKMCKHLAAKDPANAGDLVGRIGYVVEAAVNSVKKESRDNWNAVESAVHLIGCPTHNFDHGQKVVFEVDIAKSLFPDGSADVPWASGSTKDFFNTFVDSFMKSDYAKNPDNDWASRQGHSEFFRKILEKNTDEN